MPQAIAEYVADYALTTWFTDAVVTEAVYYATYAIVVAAEVSAVRWQSAQAQRKAKDAYNAALRDRYMMLRGTQLPRQLVFGRARVSGPIFFIGSYGTDHQHLSMCIALAAHEIDAVEKIYFNDLPVVLDGSNNITGVQYVDSFSISTLTLTVSLKETCYSPSVTAQVRYGSYILPLTVTSAAGSTVSVSGALPGTLGTLEVSYLPYPNPYSPPGTTTKARKFIIATGSDTFTLADTPVGGTVFAAVAATPAGVPVAVVSVVGSAVTIGGASAYIGREIYISYQVSQGVWGVGVGTTVGRIRIYTGAAGQAADSTLIANFPGIWTSAHTATGLAYLVVDLDYSQDAFSQGLPNVSAVIRGMKCFDPRTSTTAWTENPALHARALATHSLGGRMPTAQIDDAAVISEANICDTSVTYPVGTWSYTRALYKSGYVYTTDRKPADGLSDLCQAMGGSWVFMDGMLKIASGTYRTPVLSLDESWLIGDQAIDLQPTVNRADLVNSYSSSIADESQDYKVVSLPRLAPSAYITTDGGALPMDVQLNAVTFAPQAQYILSCQLRAMRFGGVIKVRCNLNAWRVQRYDVLNVSIARFGIVSQPYEVIQRAWTFDGAIELTLRQTAASIYTMDSNFSMANKPPSTVLPVPWGLVLVTSLAATSGTSTVMQQSDGSVVSRISVTWDAISDLRVVQGGYVEIRYWNGADATATYQTVKALGTDTQAYLTGVLDGGSYIIMARTVSALTVSDWCLQIRHTVAAKSTTPATATGLTYSIGGNAIRLGWNANTETDYKLTEVRVGASWGAGALVSKAPGTLVDWPATGLGTFTVWVAHMNWSNVYGTPASMTVSVLGGTVLGLTNSFSGTDLLMSWGVSAGSYANDTCEVRYGSTFAGGTVVGRFATSYRETAYIAGGRTYWVCPIDVRGNYGTPSSTVVGIAAPGAVSGVRADVIDNNVLIYWNPPSTGTLPVDHYNVVKGSTYGGGTPIGSNANSTFAGLFEQLAGTFTYWVAAVDTAGTVGTPVSVVVTVSAPPDFVLKANYNSGLGLSTPLGVLSVTLSNFYAEQGALLGPVDTTQTWATHFTSNSWTTPDAQIAAGKPIYADPSVASGTYTEVFDYGTTLTSTNITVTLNGNVITGTINPPTCQISTSPDNVTWTPLAAGFTALGSNFRYMKYVITVTNTAGANLYQITGINVKLSVKSRMDSGSATVASTGGTAVTFGYPFISADTPIVQPNGLDAFSKPFVPAVIYAGGANPTGFSVRIFNSAGTEVSGVTFSWTVRGY